MNESLNGIHGLCVCKWIVADRILPDSQNSMGLSRYLEDPRGHSKSETSESRLCLSMYPQVSEPWMVISGWASWLSRSRLSDGDIYISSLTFSSSVIPFFFYLFLLIVIAPSVHLGLWIQAITASQAGIFFLSKLAISPGLCFSYMLTLGYQVPGAAWLSRCVS